jgi:hypothetical protein
MPVKRINGFADPFFGSLQQVKASDDSTNPVFSRDDSGMFHDVHNARMTATCDRDRSLILDARDNGDVIAHLIFNQSSLHDRFERDADLLEIRQSRDLPGAQKAGHDLQWITAQKKEPSGFFDFGPAVSGRESHMPQIGVCNEMEAKGLRMSDDGEVLFPCGFQDLNQPLGVVVMAVSQHDPIQVGRLNTEESHVVEESGGVLRHIDKNSFGAAVFSGFNKEGNTMLAQERTLVLDGVFCEDGYLKAG